VRGRGGRALHFTLTAMTNQVLDPSAATARLEGVLRQLMATRHVRHAVVAIESGDGAFRWAGVAGDAYGDGTPMRVDIPFFIASVTKLHIATVILQLHEERKIALDQPIDALLPKRAISGIHSLDGIEHTGAITVRHLLSHTSGLADWLEDRPGGGVSLMERTFRGEDRSFTLDDVVETVRGLTPHFPPQPPDGSRTKALLGYELPAPHRDH
jgi:D-alanyl-D-alanine carboxypeptidase